MTLTLRAGTALLGGNTCSDNSSFTDLALHRFLLSRRKSWGLSSLGLLPLVLLSLTSGLRAQALETQPQGALASASSAALALPAAYQGPPAPIPPETITRDGAGKVTVRAQRLTAP